MVGTRSPVPTIPDSLRSLSPNAVEELLGSANDPARGGSPPPAPEGRRRVPTSSPVANPPLAIRQKKAKKKDTGSSIPAPLGSFMRLQGGALLPSSGPSGGDSSSGAGSSGNAPGASSTTIGSSGFPSAGRPVNPLVIDVDRLVDPLGSETPHQSLAISVDDIINHPNFREALRITLASHQASTPSDRVAGPSYQASTPSNKASMPSIPASLPSSGASVSLALAAFMASTPSNEASVPPALASMPSIQVSVPPIQAFAPSAQASVPPALHPLPRRGGFITKYLSISDLRHAYFLYYIIARASSSPGTATVRHSVMNPVGSGGSSSLAVPALGIAGSDSLRRSTASAATLPGSTATAATLTSSHTLPPSSMSIRLDANTVSDHPLVIRALWEGWTVHIPLTLLSNEKCRSALFVDNIGSKRDPDKNPLAFDASSEPSIPLADFMEAWLHLCHMIKTHLNSPDRGMVGDAFHRHFDQLTSRIDFHSKFSLYVEYDIYIRMYWVANPGSFNPADFQVDIWNFIQDANRDHILAAAYKPSTTRTTMSSRGFQRGRGTGGSFRGDTSSIHSGCCYVCGSTSHSGRSCPTDSNGYMSKTADGWRGPGNSLLCFRFNGIGNSCTFGGCQYAHVCSRCGDGGHSAQSHPSS
jgi:hypothetical protein